MLKATVLSISGLSLVSVTIVSFEKLEINIGSKPTPVAQQPLPSPYPLPKQANRNNIPIVGQDHCRGQAPGVWFTCYNPARDMDTQCFCP
jgi:hypothetical protein